MQKDPISIASIVSIAFGVLLYLSSVLGLFFDQASPPGDIGLISTAGVFIIFGVLGMILAKARAEAAE